jgi:Fatty acid desaturase
VRFHRERISDNFRDRPVADGLPLARQPDSRCQPARSPFRRICGQDGTDRGGFGAGWLALFAVGNSWVALAVAPVLGFSSTQVVFFGHDAGHQQIFRSRRANRVLGLIAGDALTGVSIGSWVPKHAAHHAHPNVVDRDPDIGVGASRWPPRPTLPAAVAVPAASWPGTRLGVLPSAGARRSRIAHLGGRLPHPAARPVCSVGRCTSRAAHGRLSDPCLLGAVAAAGWGPPVRDGAIVLDEVSSPTGLPMGWSGEQDGGRYRLRPVRSRCLAQLQVQASRRGTATSRDLNLTGVRTSGPDWPGPPNARAYGASLSGAVAPVRHAWNLTVVRAVCGRGREWSCTLTADLVVGLGG